MHRDRRRVPPGPPRRRGVAALAAACVLLASFCVGVALANHHWHETSGQWHGFVHGSSSNDNFFIARVDQGTIGGTRGCQIDAVWNGSGFRTEFETDPLQLCNVLSSEAFSGSPTECAYRAENYSSTFFNWHHNYPVNYCS